MTDLDDLERLAREALEAEKESAASWERCSDARVAWAEAGRPRRGSPERSRMDDAHRVDDEAQWAARTARGRLAKAATGDVILDLIARVRAAEAYVAEEEARRAEMRRLGKEAAVFLRAQQQALLASIERNLAERGVTLGTPPPKAPTDD